MSEPRGASGRPVPDSIDRTVALGQAPDVAERGAPTNKWRTVPEHLDDNEHPFDLRSSGAQLVVRRPDVPDVTVPLEKPELVIGRDVEDVDLTLDDELVSRRHARLSVNDRGYFTLEDLGSKNGIEYAGRPVRRLNLVDGDEFIIGKAHFIFSASMPRFTQAAESPAGAVDSLDDDIQVPAPEPDAEPEQGEALTRRPAPVSEDSSSEKPKNPEDPPQKPADEGPTS